MTKIIRAAAMGMLMAAAFSFSALADGVVGIAPDGSEYTELVTEVKLAELASAVNQEAGSEAPFVSENLLSAYYVSVGSDGIPTYVDEPTRVVSGAPDASPVSGSQPGAPSNGTPLSLDFKLVAPNYWRGDYHVAEGSVQLSDGSWAGIGHAYALRAPYYRVLREETDSTGVEWYVCAAYAQQLGDYRTADGSFAKELWLKKADCREVSIRPNTANETRLGIVKTALSLLGKQYSYAATGPDAFDCSGFVNYVMSQNGINVPRTSGEISGMAGQISMDSLRPGDIVARPGHVGIYIGDGVFVHSSETETGVIAESLEVYNKRNGFTNYINAVGD